MSFFPTMFRLVSVYLTSLTRSKIYNWYSCKLKQKLTQEKALCFQILLFTNVMLHHYLVWCHLALGLLFNGIKPSSTHHEQGDKNSPLYNCRTTETMHSCTWYKGVYPEREAGTTLLNNSNSCCNLCNS